MPFVSAVCPSCGGEIQLDDSKESGFCLHCGSKIVRDEAVVRVKVEHSGNVKLDSGGADSALVEYGYSIMELKPSKAKEYFEKALSINPKNHLAWNALVDVAIEKAYKSVNIWRDSPLPRDSKGRYISAHYAAFGIYYGNADVYGPFDSVVEWNARNFGFDGGYASVKNAMDMAIKHAPESEKDSFEEKKKIYITDAEQEAMNFIYGSHSGCCYIATAVYGSYDAPEVMVLRRFRDMTLAKSAPGRTFIKLYYRFSPPIAERLKSAGRINALVKSALDRLVKRLSNKQKY